MWNQLVIITFNLLCFTVVQIHFKLIESTIADGRSLDFSKQIVIPLSSVLSFFTIICKFWAILELKYFFLVNFSYAYNWPVKRVNKVT